MKRNNEIRKKAKENGVHLWQLADKLGIHDSELSKKLRYELSIEEKEQLLTLIEEMKVNQ